MPLSKDQQGNNFHLAGTTYNGGVIHQSPLHQTNNEAVCVAAQDPEVPTQIKGKGEGKLSHDKWTNEEQWGNAVTQFCVLACYRRLPNVQLNIEGTTIHSQLPSEKLPGNCSVIVADLEPRPFGLGSSQKYGLCRRARCLCLLRCSIIKRVSWCLGN